MHHHLIWPPDLTSLRDLKALLMGLENGPVLLNYLVGNAGETVLFHGHRHLGYRRRFRGKLGLVSAASTTLGDERSEQNDPTHDVAGDYWVYDLVTASNGAVSVNGCARRHA